MSQWIKVKPWFRQRKTVSEFLRQGWREIPELMVGGIIGITALVLAGYALYDYRAKDKDNRLHKSSIMVLRPTDPRVARIRKDPLPDE